MKTLIHHKDLRAVAERKQGKKGMFDRLKPYKYGTTEPWLQIEKIGLSSKSLNSNYTGEVTLYIKRGGILNINELGKLPIIMEQEIEAVPDEIRFRYPKNKFTGKDLNKIKQGRKVEAVKKSSSYAREINTLFKLNVFPSIKNFAPDCGDSFILNLHYSNRQLLIIDLK